MFSSQMALKVTDLLSRTVFFDLKTVPAQVGKVTVFVVHCRRILTSRLERLLVAKRLCSRGLQHKTARYISMIFDNSRRKL